MRLQPILAKAQQECYKLSTHNIPPCCSRPCTRRIKINKTQQTMNHKMSLCTSTYEKEVYEQIFEHTFGPRTIPNSKYMGMPGIIGMRNIKNPTPHNIAVTRGSSMSSVTTISLVRHI